MIWVRTNTKTRNKTMIMLMLMISNYGTTELAASTGLASTNISPHTNIVMQLLDNAVYMDATEGGGGGGLRTGTTTKRQCCQIAVYTAILLKSNGK
jgi:hypothetical protein